MSLLAGLRRLTLLRFARAEGGVSAVEFALILPVMILLYVGSIELSLALSTDRKVDQVASTVGDLVAQYSVITTAQIGDIFDASAAIMEPNDPSNIRIVVAAVEFGPDLSQTVKWSRARNRTAFPVNEPPPVQIPDDLAEENTQIVVSLVDYDFSTPFSGMMESVTGHDGYTFEHMYLLRPRLQDTIKLQ